MTHERKPIRHRLWGFAALIIVVGAWTLLSASHLLPRTYFPSLPQVFGAAVEDRADLFGAAAESFATAGLGYVLGFVFAILVGIPMGRYVAVERLLRPNVDFLRAVPAVVMIPVFLLVVGSRELVGVLSVAWACFFLAVINIAAGAAQASSTLELAVRTFGGREFVVLRKAVLPSLLPYILASLRQTVAVALLVVVVVDMTLGVSGLGFYILAAQGVLSMDEVYAAVILVSLVGVTSYRGIETMERRMFPWWSRQINFG